MNAADYTTEVIAGVHLIERTGGYSLENPNLPLNDPAVWEAVFNDTYGTATGINVTAEKALMYAPLWHAVSLISDDVARLPLYVYKRRPDISEDARERDRAHQLNYLLSVAANEETESIKFWGRFMVHALLWGNGYAFIDRDGTGRPAGLYNLLPDRTHPERVDGRLVYVTEAGARLKVLLPEDVLHIEGLNIASGAAMTVFRQARNSIALGLAQENFASKFFANGGRIGGVLELPLGMPKPARDTLEEGFRKTYEGNENPFKTVILRDNAKFHAAQMSPRESQMTEGTESQTRMIAHWFKLAPSKLGLSDSVSYNSKAEDNQNYLDTALSIWLARIASACNYKLLSTRSTDTHFVEHSIKSLLRMNLQAQADSFQKLIAARVLNPNEARAELNRLPYDGGDEFVNPNTLKAGSPDGTPPTEPPPTPAKPPPKRSSEFLRMLFELTSRAREKSRKPEIFLKWIDANLETLRSIYKGSEPFPFDYAVRWLKAKADTCPHDEFVSNIDQLCDFWERDQLWNAE
jgi:HK97 family phage portal protein